MRSAAILLKLVDTQPLYVNLHTTASYAANKGQPLGLIRGQVG